MNNIDNHGTTIADDLAEGALRAAWHATLTEDELAEFRGANHALVLAGGFPELAQKDNPTAVIGARFELRFRAWKRDLLARASS